MSNEKMKFEAPVVEIITFQEEDILTTSGGLELSGFFGDDDKFV